jgi:hypothetical protein
MAAAVRGRAFAKRVGIPRKVSGEFNQAEQLFRPAKQDVHHAAFHFARLS